MVYVNGIKKNFVRTGVWAQEFVRSHFAKLALIQHVIRQVQRPGQGPIGTLPTIAIPTAIVGAILIQTTFMPRALAARTIVTVCGWLTLLTAYSTLQREAECGNASLR